MAWLHDSRIHVHDRMPLAYTDSTVQRGGSQKRTGNTIKKKDSEVPNFPKKSTPLRTYMRPIRLL